MARSGQSRSSAIARLVGMAGLLMLLLTAIAAPAQTFTVLHTFTGGSDGDSPYAGLSMDRAGNLYGTAAFGGNGSGNCQEGGCGTVYRLVRKNSSWLFYTLYAFSGSDGQNPEARVIIGPDGNLYGTTTYGGTANWGTVFRLQPPATACKAYLCPWTETVLHSFQGGSDGENPAYGDLTFDQAGNIYGTTPYGGSNGCGVVYELSPSNGSWIETILYTFKCGKDGYQPYAGVIFDKAGNLYGTTTTGGNGYGNVFKLTRSGSVWTESSIYNFAFPGGAYGGLIFDSSGNLYGITFFTPQVYELSPSNGAWTYNVLYSFQGYGAVAPLTMDAAGNLYGTIFLGDVEVFRLTPSNGQWTLTGFNGNAGSEPYGNVILDASGNLYSTATYDPDCVFEITP